MHPETRARLSQLERARRAARFERQHLRNLLAWHGEVLGEGADADELVALTWREIDTAEALRFLLAGRPLDAYAHVKAATAPIELDRLYRSAGPRNGA